MAKIYLGYPILDKPEADSIMSVFQAILSCVDHAIMFKPTMGESLISRSRNNHVNIFLNETDCDYFMFIDSDLHILNTHPTNNIFSKLVSHDLDFVGGLYALKNDKETICSSRAMDNNETCNLHGGLRKMRWLSTGCWCLKRSVVEKMVSAYPELIYDGDDIASGKKISGLFNPYIYTMNKDEFGYDRDIKKYLSEDWAFCQRWLNIHGEIYADTSIILNHIGKKEYKLWDVVPYVATKEESEVSEVPEPGFDLKENE